ncbi:MAG: MFS transporter [Oscillospiraceae bacterium]
MQFFLVCWITYFSTYIGRLNFLASMSAIIDSEGYDKTQLGLVAAAFFFAYGVGQLISGILGDRIPPRKLVFLGVFLSALINLAMGMSTHYIFMIVLWLLNGLVQSMTWSPIARLVSDRLLGKDCVKTCFNLSTTVPAGTLITYLMCSLIIQYANWRVVFFVAGGILLAISFVWNSWMKKLEEEAETNGIIEDCCPVSNNAQMVERKKSMWSILIPSGFLLIVMAVMIDGILKDGVMTWVPSYLSEIFNTTPAFSIGLTTLLPIVNLLGIYLANYLYTRVIKNEVVVSALFFATTLIALSILIFFGNKSIILSLLMLSIVTSSMLGINTILVNIVPLSFKSVGKVSTVSGVLNSSTYLGSALSTYMIGNIAQQYGWNVTRIVWLALAIGGIVVCLCARKIWWNFRKTLTN